jgi:hypothetical protein
LRPGGYVEVREDAGNLIRMLGAHFAPVVVFVQTPQPAMLKMPDHRGFVK